MIVPTYTVKIHIAGDLAVAKQTLRRECFEEGLCVTVKAQTFIYTMGEEEGVVIELVNYPRFPTTPEALLSRARRIALRLRDDLCQKTALLVAPDVTEWLPREGKS